MMTIKESLQRRHDMFVSEMQAVLDKYCVDVFIEAHPEPAGYPNISVWLQYNRISCDGQAIAPQSMRLYFGGAEAFKSGGDSRSVDIPTLPWEMGQ